MATHTYIGGIAESDSLFQGWWFAPQSWADGLVPQAGDTAVIASGNPAIDPDFGEVDHDLSLDNVTVTLLGSDTQTPGLFGYSVAYGPHLQLNFVAAAGAVAPSAWFSPAGQSVFRGNMDLTAANGSFTIGIDAMLGGASFTLAGSATVTLANAVHVNIADGPGAELVNNGTIRIGGHSILDSEGPIAGNGSILLQDGGTLHLSGPLGPLERVQFLDGTGTLVLDGSGGADLGSGLASAGPIQGFRPGDTITLTGLLAPPSSLTFLSRYDILAVRDASGALLAKLRLDGSYRTADFHLAPSAGGPSGSFDITLSPTQLVAAADAGVDIVGRAGTAPLVASSGTVAASPALAGAASLDPASVPMVPLPPHPAG